MADVTAVNASGTLMFTAIITTGLFATPLIGHRLKLLVSDRADDCERREP